VNAPEDENRGFEQTRKLRATIVVGALIVACTTTWIGLSVSGFFASLPGWVSYAVVGADVIAIAVVWSVMTRSRAR
jgi:hypothetical protein